MHTVMITMRYGLIARNVLRTDILQGLLDEGLRVIVVCPAANEQYLKDEIENGQVTLVPFPYIKFGRFERVFEMLADALLFGHPGVTHTMTSKWLDSLTEGHWVSFLLRGLVGLFFLHKFRFLRFIAEKCDRRWFSHESIKGLFDHYRPSLFVSTDLFGMDHAFVREAAQRKIQNVCLVKSWDNLTSKTRIRVHPDQIVVWSKFQADEAARLHFFPQDRIFISGSPNFDHLAPLGASVSPRDSFLRRIGANPDRKLILYSSANKLTYSDEANIRRLHRIFESGVLGYKCHLHIRKYPKAQQDFSYLLSLPHVTVEDAGRVVLAWDDCVDQSREELTHVRELITYTDILVQIGSTIALDAACMNKPVIGYFLEEEISKAPWYDYVHRVRNFTHNHYLEELGGVKIVTSEPELVHGLKSYLDDPTLNSQGRSSMVRSICGEVDGKAGERVAKYLISQLHAKVK